MGKSKKLYDEIVRLAYNLYEQRGRVHGYHLEDWLEAERIVIEKEANAIGSTKGKKALGKTEPRTLKTSKKTSESISQAKTRKSPPSR